MFRSMRRIKQQLSIDETRNILEIGLRGFLSVISDDGYPYIIPLNYVIYEDKIYFHSAKEGHKIESIKNNNKASFCVLNDGIKEDDNWWYTFKSIIIFGKIKLVNDANTTNTILELLGKKYFPSDDITKEEIKKYADKTQIIELSIEHITGKYVNEK